MTTVKDPVERFAIDKIRAMLLRTFLAPTSFVDAVMWTIWAQAAEPITVLAPFNRRLDRRSPCRIPPRYERDTMARMAI
jgi:hypothetical protein